MIVLDESVQLHCTAPGSATAYHVDRMFGAIEWIVIGVDEFQIVVFIDVAEGRHCWRGQKSEDVIEVRQVKSIVQFVLLRGRRRRRSQCRQDTLPSCRHHRVNERVREQRFLLEHE